MPGASELKTTTHAEISLEEILDLSLSRKDYKELVLGRIKDAGGPVRGTDPLGYHEDYEYLSEHDIETKATIITWRKRKLTKTDGEGTA